MLATAVTTEAITSHNPAARETADGEEQQERQMNLFFNAARTLEEAPKLWRNLSEAVYNSNELLHNSKFLSMSLQATPKEERCSNQHLITIVIKTLAVGLLSSLPSCSFLFSSSSHSHGRCTWMGLVAYDFHAITMASEIDHSLVWSVGYAYVIIT